LHLHGWGRPPPGQGCDCGEGTFASNAAGRSCPQGEPVHGRRQSACCRLAVTTPHTASIRPPTQAPHTPPLTFSQPYEEKKQTENGMSRASVAGAPRYSPFSPSSCTASIAVSRVPSMPAVCSGHTPAPGDARWCTGDHERAPHQTGVSARGEAGRKQEERTRTGKGSVSRGSERGLNSRDLRLGCSNTRRRR